VSRDLAALDAAVRAATTEAGRAWLDEAVDAVAANPEAVRTRFPAAGRTLGRAPVDPALGVERADEGGRVLLLAALPRPDDELLELYDYGDGDERAAVLRALPCIDVYESIGLRLVEDALRTHDTRLVTAALGPYGVARLPAGALRQGVLKAVFMGLPLDGIAGLDGRADPELARMLAGYAHERIAAGRSVPADIWPLVLRFPPAAELAAIEAELAHPTADRRRAAESALADSQTASR
jgi:hypothetical protein